jgi:hypothetical protein
VPPDSTYLNLNSGSVFSWRRLQNTLLSATAGSSSSGSSSSSSSSDSDSSSSSTSSSSSSSSGNAASGSSYASGASYYSSSHCSAANCRLGKVEKLWLKLFTDLQLQKGGLDGECCIVKIAKHQNGDHQASHKYGTNSTNLQSLQD